AVNQAFTNQAVATFTDPGGAEPNTIDNPGSPTDDRLPANNETGDETFAPPAGTITVSGSVFTVLGGHTYNSTGSFPVSVTITHRSEERRVGKECRTGGTPHHKVT